MEDEESAAPFNEKKKETAIGYPVQTVGSGRDERAPAYVRNVNGVDETADVPADADGDAEEDFSKRVSWAEVVKGGFESAHSLETIPV